MRVVRRVLIATILAFIATTEVSKANEIDCHAPVYCNLPTVGPLYFKISMENPNQENLYAMPRFITTARDNEEHTADVRYPGWIIHGTNDVRLFEGNDGPVIMSTIFYERVKKRRFTLIVKNMDGTAVEKKIKYVIWLRRDNEDEWVEVGRY